MRVAVLTHGTRGDIQPFIALALELEARGHDVTICGPCSTSELVRTFGVKAYSLTFDAKKMVTSDDMQAAMQKGDGNECVKAAMDNMKLQRGAGANSPDEADQFLCEYQADVVVGNASFMSCICVAEKHCLPVVNAMFMPFLPSQTSHSSFQTLAAIAAEGNLEKPLDGHRKLYDAFLGPDALTDLNILRERWGLRPYSASDELHAVFQGVPTANCWSPATCPEPSDMSSEFPHAEQTGYCFLDDPEYQPPEDLAAFLQVPHKDKPVCIGFGSLASGDPREITEKVVRALIIAGRQRCVMVGGWSGIGPEHLHPARTPDYSELKAFCDTHVCKVDAAPHGWLLPHCCAAVHHGGAGTTAAVARAGLPTAIAPFAWDQPWWAERMHELGVGIALSGMITNVTEEELGLSIERLVTDKSLVQQAAALGESIRSERCGVKKLADFVVNSTSLQLPWATKTQPNTSPFPPALWHRSLTAETPTTCAALPSVLGAGQASPYRCAGA